MLYIADTKYIVSIVRIHVITSHALAQRLCFNSPATFQVYEMFNNAMSFFQISLCLAGVLCICDGRNIVFNNLFHLLPLSLSLSSLSSPFDSQLRLCSLQCCGWLDYFISVDVSSSTFLASHLNIQYSKLRLIIMKLVAIAF